MVGMNAKEVINMLMPCRVDKIVDYVENAIVGYSYDAYPSGLEIKQELLAMYGKREIDIMFTNQGHPVVVYGNWRIACPWNKINRAYRRR